MWEQATPFPFLRLAYVLAITDQIAAAFGASLRPTPNEVTVHSLLAPSQS